MMEGLEKDGNGSKKKKMEVHMGRRWRTRKREKREDKPILAGSA